MATNRIYADGDVLLMAPAAAAGGGYIHTLSERAYLVESLQAFITKYSLQGRLHDITIYELRELNLKREER